MRRVEERHSRHGAKTEAPTTAQAHTSSVVPKDLSNLKKTKDGEGGGLISEQGTCCPSRERCINRMQSKRVYLLLDS